MSHVTATRRGRVVASAALGAAALIVASCTATGGADNSAAASSDTGAVAQLTAVPELIDLLPADIRDRGTLTVPVAGAVPPTSFVDERGEIVGITGELVKALGTVFDLDITLEAPAFAGVLPAIDAGRYEVGFPGATITQARESSYDMVSYLDLSYTIATKPERTDIVGKWTGELSDLCGLTLADVQGNLATPYIEGDIAGVCQQKGLQPAKVVVFADGAAEDLAVQSGQVDARVMNTLSAIYRQQETPDQWVAGSVRYLSSPLGTVTAKGNGLAEVIAQGLNYLIKQGAYQQIFEKWNSAEAALDKAVVNPPTDIVGR